MSLTIQSSNRLWLSRSIRFPSTTSRHSRKLYSTSSSPSQPNVRRNAFLAVSLLAAAGAVYCHETRTSSHPVSSTQISRSKSLVRDLASSEFSVRIQHGHGVEEYKFLRKSDKEVEDMLTVNQVTRVFDRNGNPVRKVDTNWVGSNEPCEDRSAIDLVPRTVRKKQENSLRRWWNGTDNATTGPEHAVDRIAPLHHEQDGSRDLTFFSVLDGHAGSATSQLLSKTLHPTLALALAGLEAGYLPDTKSGWSKAHSRYLNPVSWILKSGADFSPENVALTLQQAFVQLDDNICQTPIRLLRHLPKQTLRSNDKPSPNETFIALTEPADAGACALTALVDSENQSLYVALAGDCRAVAGWQGEDGKWRCDVLTEDQMGENPREVKRMKSEHPASESESVIRNGRIQGGLQPTRAFGDAVYKWTMSQAAAVSAVFSEEGKRARSQRPRTITPPYCTAKPEVTYRSLKSQNGEKLKFLIMATDGLWDRITSEEAALLVAGYLTHPSHQDIPKSELPSEIPFVPVPPAADRLYPVQDLPGSPTRSEGSWVFEGDNNAATHLIRNSLGGGDRRFRDELLSLRGKISRLLRDDVTVSVISF